MVQELVLIVHIVIALSIIGLVLLQHGKGADMGAAFGSGSAGSLFGSSGASNFLSKSTAVCATIFFVTCLSLTYFTAPRHQSGVMGTVKTQQKAPASPASPAVPATAAPVPTDAPAKTDDAKSKEIPK